MAEELALDVWTAQGLWRALGREGHVQVCIVEAPLWCRRRNGKNDTGRPDAKDLLSLDAPRKTTTTAAFYSGKRKGRKMDPIYAALLRASLQAGCPTPVYSPSGLMDTEGGGGKRDSGSVSRSTVRT